MDNIIDKALTALLAVACAAFLSGAACLVFAGVVALWFQAEETALLAARVGLGFFVIMVGALVCGGAAHQVFNNDGWQPPSVF